MITRHRAWRISSKLLLASAVCRLFAIAAPADSIELITNGNFETGAFAGWSVVNQTGSFPGSNWFIDTPGTTTPVSGMATSSAGGLPHGSFYAVTDQGGPGSHSLLQTFTVLPAASSIVLSFDMFNNNWDSGPFGTSQDFTITPNQHARVDILTSGAGAFDTGAGVLGNFFLGGTPVTSPNPFTHFSFDVTSLLSSGGTFQLRFAEVDNQLFFNMGVDNVSIQETVIPEPGSFILLLAGIGVTVLYHRSRKS
jgi:hypothetical protein